MRIPVRCLAPALGALLVFGIAGCRSPKEMASSVGSSVASAAKAPGRWIGNRGGEDETTRQVGGPEVSRAAPPPPGEPTGNRELDGAVELMAEQRFDEALGVLDRAVRSMPTNPDPHSLRGDCLYQLLRFDEAVAAYEQALKLDPGYLPALRGLGFVELNRARRLRGDGQRREAFDSYSRSFELLRDVVEVRSDDGKAHYGMALAAEGVALFYYERSLHLQRVMNDMHGAETMRDRALAYCDEGIAAAEIYRRQAPRDPGPRVLMARLFMRTGTLYDAFGQNARAKQAITHALAAWEGILSEIDPHHAQARNEAERCREILRSWGVDV